MFKMEVEKDLALALVEPKFASKYLAIVSNQRDYLSEWLTWPPQAKNEEFFLNFIKKSLHEYADGKSLVCAMMFQNEVAGNISFNTINHDLQKVEIGYWLRRDLQGKGIVSKSLSKLINYAFTELNMQKVEISAAVDNQASRSVCERLGFKQEGIITRAEKLNDRVVDHVIYGLSRNSVAQTY